MCYITRKRPQGTSTELLYPALHIKDDKTPTEMLAFRSAHTVMIYMHAAPSMPRTLPLIHSPSWEARKQTTRAMSMGSPTRWRGDQPAAN